MILSDREILAALDRGVFRITPMPLASSDQWSSTALDLTIDARLQVWKPLADSLPSDLVDPSAPGFNATALALEHAAPGDCTSGFVIEPGMFLLAWTIEKVQLPHTSRIAARVEGKSSLARIGIGVHVTAPTIHAGFGYRRDDPNFEGNPIQLEIWNAGPLRVLLRRGMPICQLIFEEVHGTPDKGYEGRFAVQGPSVPQAPDPAGSTVKEATPP